MIHRHDTIIIGDLNVPLSIMDRLSRQNVNEGTVDLNLIAHIDQIDIYRTFYPTVAGYAFFSNTHNMFSRINHMIAHKTNFSKLKKTETIPSIFLTTIIYN